ncbi:OB-fold nucleic acid binding domain-containing protein [Luteococcus sp. Sow4_B9]|uniref:OB-fold nucleic acid binding domain-containing protein n=1 Tax=Luteococcus sp. Sow4_B9 TaxID=3438792 RepID=UPI003F9993C1
MSMFSRSLRRFQAQDTPAENVAPDHTRSSIATVTPRRVAVVRGRVRSATVTPDGPRWLEATIDDGTGELVLIWMGRHSVLGVEQGRLMEVEGLVTRFQGRLAIYNPKYTLLPG